MDGQQHELYEAVLLAHVMARIDSARKYGFVTGGPEIDMAQVDRWLAAGEEHEIRPSEEAIDAAALQFIAEVNAQRAETAAG